MGAESAKRPILAFAPNDWDGPKMNRQHLLSRLAQRGWPVVYSTGAPHFWSRRTTEWKRLPLLGTFVNRDGVLVDRPSRLLLRRETSRTWDRLVIRTHLRRLLRGLRTSPGSVICYVFHPSFWPYVEALNPTRLVYHVYDAFHLTTEWSARMEEAQAQLVDRASLLIATSLPMAESFPGARSASVKELPNAVDFDLFAPPSEPPFPPDLGHIARPRIVHAGSINEKVDLGLLRALALTRPDWNWVLLGHLSSKAHANGEFGRLWSSCVALPNVHYLGAKPHQDLPGYLQHADVNVMCYQTSGVGWWQRLYPLRLHELLAAGRPVVASRLETLVPFSHVLALPTALKEWTQALEHAIVGGGVSSVPARRLVASQNTWAHRVTELEGWLFSIAASRSSAP